MVVKSIKKILSFICTCLAFLCDSSFAAESFADSKLTFLPPADLFFINSVLVARSPRFINLLLILGLLVYALL